MAVSTIVKKMLVISLLGAMIAAAAITIAKGVEQWLMFGTTCIIGGCVAIKSGSTGGWAGIVFGLLSYLFAGGIQSGQVNSGLRKRELYTEAQILDGTFLHENLEHMGFPSNDAASLVKAIVHGASDFSLGGTPYTVAKHPNGRVQISAPVSTSKRDGEQYQAYTDEEIDLVYMDSGAMSEWANDIGNAIVSNFGDSEAICAEIEEQTETGGYAFAGLQISQSGTDLSNDGSCDYANYDRKRAVKVQRRYVPEKL